MFTKIEKLCILAFVIAPVLMFGNANGFSELLKQQPATQASTKITTATATTNQLTLAATKTAKAAAILANVATEITTQTVGTTAAAATPVPTPTTSVTTTTLASSNAPATITNDVGTAAIALSLQQQQQQEHVQQRKNPEQNNAATATISKAATTTMRTTTAMTMSAKTIESTEMPTMNFGSKSRAFVAAETAETATTSTYHESDGGNKVKIQIKNAKKQTSKLNKMPTNEQRQQEQRAVEQVEQQSELVTANEEQETAATTTKIIATEAGERVSSFSVNSKINAARHETTTSPPTMPTFTRDGVHLERKLAKDLYRIKLAEFVADDGAPLEFPFTKENHRNAENPITTETPINANTALNTENPINATVTATRKPSEVDQSPRLQSPLLTNADSNKIIATADSTNSGDDKLNKVDLLYHPLKMLEDFNPIIRDSNAKLLKERTIFTRTDDIEEYRQNLMPNEVEMQQNVAGSAEIKPKSSTVNHAPANMMKRKDSISDFTGKLLAEQDGVITEIEQKFRLSEEAQRFVVTTTEKSSTSQQEENMPAAAATTTTAAATSTPTAFTEIISSKPAASSYSVNHKIQRSTGAGGVGHDFIDRRVKKSFDFPFPIHRAASDVMSMPHIDFANTKFNSDTNGNPAKRAGAGVSGDAGGSIAGSTTNSKQPLAVAAAIANGAHPEFSTTKFYNSKELYNEMLLHNKQKQRAINSIQTTTTTSAAAAATNRNVDVNVRGISNSLQLISNTASRFATLQSPTKLKTLKTIKDDSSNPIIVTPVIATTTTTTQAAAADTTALPTTGAIKRVTLSPTMAATVITTTATPSTTTTSSLYTLTTSSSSTHASKSTSKYQKELKRAKLLLKALLPLSTAATVTAQKKATPATTTSHSNITTTAKTTTMHRPAIATAATSAPAVVTATGESFSSTSLPSTEKTFVASPRDAGVVNSGALYPTDDDSISSSPISTYRTATRTYAATTTSSSTSNLSPHHRTTNPTKSTSKPIVRPRILSRLQEKINSLECEIQNVPQDSHLWRGNETHELLLPIVTPENCKNDDAVEDCSPLLVSWEGEAEIQSGDILIVEINDALLNPNDKNNTNSAHTTQVYQVTRSGHEHCDVTEGILLDITPLVVDGRKLVTLYDKDLTEGVNLLIVVSELWGSQCVRLKVTTKTDNCGENAECSGKGVCYSNVIMEEYECQCCSGFAGPHCEEIDACTPSPCTNNGICVDLSQGHEGNSYQCLCPYGYTGKNCQYESDPCNSAECMNGGSCVGNSTHFRCDCTPGYAGPLCQHSLNECESSPCVHGICVDQEDGFRCFCQPGFAGELCNFEYNECESNPCQNDGECIDHIGSYECHCSKGYTGNRCQIKVDFCANKPCPEGHRCIDHGNEFSCECPGGRNGPDCNQMPRTQCNVNPCTHGGTCWSSGDSFYCACRPGYTGTMCEDEFVVETVVSSSEFIVDDTSARNFNDKTFGSSVVLKSPIELHNAYFAAGVLAAAIFIVAIVVTICHCKVNQTYRKFSTRSSTFFPILGFGRRHKSQNKLNKHWLSGKGLAGGSGGGGSGNNCSGNPLRSSSSTASLTRSGHHHHLPASNVSATQGGGGGQLHERPFQRHLAMNLENDMYYTVDFSENSQHSPLIQ